MPLRLKLTPPPLPPPLPPHPRRLHPLPRTPPLHDHHQSTLLSLATSPFHTTHTTLTCGPHTTRAQGHRPSAIDHHYHHDLSSPSPSPQPKPRPVTRPQLPANPPPKRGLWATSPLTSYNTRTRSRPPHRSNIRLTPNPQHSDTMASSSTPDSANTSRPKGIHVATSTRKEPVEPLRRPPNPYTEALCNVAITLIEHSWHQLHHSLTDHTESHFVYYRYVDNRFTAFNRTFLKHLAIQTLIHPDFYSNPMELEPVGDMHLLGFDVDLHQRTISYIPPDAPWKIRDHASAGSARLQLSGLHSRAHLIRKYTYPSSAVERALAQLADLYVQKGHDLRSCRQALQKSLRINPLCFLAVFPNLPVQSAPNAALCVCVCQRLFPRISHSISRPSSTRQLHDTSSLGFTSTHQGSGGHS